ncbi:unnamed protein product [Psylliodes chrysocephalus]|uniref:Uncharacterized protein n=1 Tax=Psylliodes chrysocephalus TaxID=3402493 RepID=A0A9P0CJL0_9CUCU|nr:unnamed protein product [Psylliodes chrysocephala]
MGKRKDSYVKRKNFKTTGLNLNRAKVKTFVRSILDGILDCDEFSTTTSNIILEKVNRTTETDIDVDAAHGAMSVGLGFWNTEELFSVLNLPFMLQTKYNKCQISDAWEQTSSKQMAIAAKE